jgi:hypothetical protein
VLTAVSTFVAASSLLTEQPRAINNNPIAAAAINAKTCFDLILFASRIVRLSPARWFLIRRAWIALTIASLAVFLNPREKLLAITVARYARLRALITYPQR